MYINTLHPKPKSWWRHLLGYRAVKVIDKLSYLGPGEYEVASGHWEWKWRPNRKR